MRTFTVKNFESFNHYKSAEGSPKWIKLYRDLLADYDFQALDDAARSHLVLIWLLYSQVKKPLPLDPKWIGQRIAATSKVDLDALVNAGFLVLEQSSETTLERSAESALEPNPKSPSSLVLSDLVSSSSEPDREFDGFWKSYPRKDAKQDARKAWGKLSDADRRTALDDLPRRLAANWAGRELDKLPHASTYLNQKRWTDEIQERTPARASPSPSNGHLGAAYQSVRETLKDRFQGDG